jgi:hypothetical protein
VLRQFQDAYERAPQSFDENPIDVPKRNGYIHVFHDPNPTEVISFLGVE